eukprot:CAMPEP_0201551578 /NCGR_PEP_ID=MMETSP0173_2-20130828/7729_1 /ASSEMBLY_ACC=CAM_ASM_000268 /TAXON_ID=218659 /ORGANISM="Vexillifera sp., Strain DIVA3 564/2" /LENGTH=285 /DNA_ID=CAMNT_0047961869 /DNA_START=63 /DNA_END=920 /DNA_ORIENTATION=+
MAADITEEEIIQICNNFLLSSPPGEFMEVVTDVRGLLYDDSLINDTAPAIFREYNTDQMLAVQSGDHQVLITKYGEISDSEYLDPRSKQVIGFDHIRQEPSGQNRGAGNAIDSSVEPTRAAFDGAAQKYCDEHYMNGVVTTYGAKVSGNTNITVCLSSAKFNPNNFWNGRWRSVWTCVVKGNKATLSGNIKINVHYYEDGNVQLNTETTKTTSVNGGSPAALAEASLEAIKKIESDFHTALEHSYSTMSETTFKALRRTLPITRCKIDWNKIRNYRIGGEAAAGR